MATAAVAMAMAPMAAAGEKLDPTSNGRKVLYNPRPSDSVCTHPASA
jgi:hypothetical protein